MNTVTSLQGKRVLGKAAAVILLAAIGVIQAAALILVGVGGSLSESTCHCHDCSCGSVVLLYVIFWW